VDDEPWLAKEGELIKSIEGKIAESQDIEKPKSYNPGSEKQEKAKQSDFEASQAAQGLTRDPIDFRNLFDEYCESRVVLLPVEPYLIHAYWDVTHNDIEKAKQRLGDDYRKSQAILRFYDVTNIIYDGTNAHGFFDVDIDLQSQNWYVDLWSPDKSYFVDLGFKTRDGFFLPVARSSVAKTPCAWPAPKADEHYMSVAEDEEGLSKIEVPEEPLRDDLIKAGKAEAKVEILKAEHLKEKELPDEDKGARTIDLPQSIPRKLFEPCEVQRKPPLKPELPMPQSIQAQYEKGVDFDLTEMSEKAFTLGISSEFISSTQGKNDSADRL
jgi:hypothetical protein